MPIGLRDVKAPILSTQLAHRWQSGYLPYAPAAALLPKNIIFVLLVLILLVSE
jgi:hypothetical protein